MTEFIAENTSVKLTFKPAVAFQRELIHGWLYQDYMQQWIHGQGLQNTLDGFEKWVEHNAPNKCRDRALTMTQHWIGFDGDKPFVYLLTSNVFKNSDDYAKHSEEEGAAITLDIFIGDPGYLGRGLAVKVIHEFLWNHFADVAEVFIDPEKSNERAVHVYQKAGFKIVGEFIAPWHPVPHHIMRLNMKDLLYILDSVELSAYDPKWPKMAKDEIEHLKKLFPGEHILDIQHVGSTAIPGMMVKPIIDIQIAVDSLVAAKQFAISALEANDYVYWHDNPDPERMFFVKGMPPYGERRTHHVHMVEPSSRHWQGKIQFRDYLLSHPEAAREYEAIKLALAEKYRYDRERYTDEKTIFVNKILKRCKKTK